MKILYTISFFTGTLILIYLSFHLLILIDKGFSTWGLVLTLAGISVSIALLAYLLYRFFKVPPSGSDN
jgi:hypothetical protein